MWIFQITKIMQKNVIKALLNKTPPLIWGFIICILGHALSNDQECANHRQHARLAFFPFDQMSKNTMAAKQYELNEDFALISEGGWTYSSLFYFPSRAPWRAVGCLAPALLLSVPHTYTTTTYYQVLYSMTEVFVLTHCWENMKQLSKTYKQMQHCQYVT